MEAKDQGDVAAVKGSIDATATHRPNGEFNDPVMRS